MNNGYQCSADCFALKRKLEYVKLKLFQLEFVSEGTVFKRLKADTAQCKTKAEKKSIKMQRPRFRRYGRTKLKNLPSLSYNFAAMQYLYIKTVRKIISSKPVTIICNFVR